MQGGERKAGGGATSQHKNLPRTMPLNVGWIGDDCRPLESQQTSVPVDESESLQSLQRHTSSKQPEEEIILFQTASQERARPQNVR